MTTAGFVSGGDSADAVIIGAGHNGLVAANLLADAGWDVLVLETQPQPGGAVRSGELTRPGFTHDLFSAFYPLAAASPVFTRLDLPSYGVRWRRSPAVLAHPTPDGRCAVLFPDIADTAASLDTYAEGDGDAWRRLYGLWERIGDRFLDTLLSPFPPVVAGARLLTRADGPADLLRFARHLLLPARRLGEETFHGAGGSLLLAGNALHTDLAPEQSGSGLFGWLLCSIGQNLGFPLPEGGAGQLTAALVDRLQRRGGRLQCGARVDRIEVRNRQAVGVVTSDGTRVAARRAVLADVLAPRLYLDLVGAEHLSAAVVDDLNRFQLDHGTVKVVWALDGPIPWSAEGAAAAGTVHVADDLDDLTMYAAELATGRVPRSPFLVVGQPAKADPTRSPPGTETAWGYTHVPRRPRGDAGGMIAGSWDHDDTERFADRIEQRVERLAPGFRGRILDRHVFTPPKMAEANESLEEGAVNAGTAQLHQQLIFRPIPGLARPETPVKGLYLASSSAHPGGGVHGAPGANAAAAAVAGWRRRRLAARLIPGPAKG